jgi:hypothetical protein
MAMEKRDRTVETPADLLRRKLLEIIAIIPQSYISKWKNYKAILTTPRMLPCSSEYMLEILKSRLLCIS